MTTRCKMICVSKTTYQNSTGVGVKLQAVYADGKSPENQAFFDATPSGEITVHVKKAEVADSFELGAFYYVDFTKAEEPAPQSGA